MSGVNLLEFNILSKHHNYFMTNNGKNGFPTLKNNSSFLQKILKNKASNLNHSIKDFGINNPKKNVTFIKEQNIPDRNNYQSPFINKRNPNISNDIYYGQRNNRHIEDLSKEYYISNNKKIISYNKDQNENINNDLYESSYYKIPIKLRNIPLNSPDIYNQHTNVYSTSNINESEGERGVLNFKGRKFFNVNSFSVSKNDTTLYSPEKNMSKSRAESELFRNPKELRKKREEIYQRKIKRESSAIKRDILRKEKDKEIKYEKVDIDINAINNQQNPINKNKRRINRRNNNEFNNNLIKINDRFKSIDIYLNSNTINENNKNPNTNTNTNTNSIITKNNPATIRRIYKYRVNKEKLNELTNENSNDKKNNYKVINTISNNNTAFPPERNKKLFKNVYITRSIDYFPQKKFNNTYVHKKIKENLNVLQKSKKTLLENDSNNQKTYNNISSDKNNNNSYNFFISRKRFIEDHTLETPIIYSNDKKVSIRLHTLQNLNEIFLGKKPTKDKLRFQRIINIFFDQNAKINHKNFYNRRNYKVLSSIKEEKEKSKAEPVSQLIKEEQKLERKEKPAFQRNIRKKYLYRHKK